ncbi:hypothetical protein F4803DRAFT_8702 [Xylaria telfairii]|nr:hypothetical protein F4803DRAFT_8702 [Xylaria telfairii]
MSSCSRGCAPIVVNRRSKSDYPGLDNLIPIETVTSRPRQFCAFPGDIDSFFKGPDSTERERVTASASYRRPPHSLFTDPWTDYLDVPDFWTLPASQIFVFHNCGRDTHENAHDPGIRPPVLLRPSSCRKSFSMGHLCSKFGHMEIYSSSGQHCFNAIEETQFNPIHTHLPTPNHSKIRPFTNPLLLKESQNLPLVSSRLRHTPYIERWRSARDIFAQYNISRPSSWLSDIEDLSLSGDGNASPRRYCRYCHICSIPTLAPTYCPSCGHRLCERCKCEVSSGTPQAHANFSHHPSPAIARDGPQHVPISRTNPEFVQRLPQRVGMACSTPENRDQDYIDTQLHRLVNLRTNTSRQKNEGRGRETTFSEMSNSISSYYSQTSERQPGQIQAQSMQHIKRSPVSAKGSKGEEQETGYDLHPGDRMECDDPMCRATHAGHYPFRHSVSCPKRRSEQRQALEPGDVSNRPAQAIVEKFDSDKSLAPDDVPHRHHSAGFHSYHHITEHLSSALGHNVYDLLVGRNRERIGSISPKASIKRSPYLEPLTKPKPVTQIEAFQWSQDTVLPGHPGRSGDRRQQPFPVTNVTRIISNRPPQETTDNGTTHKAKNTTLGEAAIRHKERETPDGLNLTQRDKESRKPRVVGTPPWLRNPSKEAANATAPLHHINARSNEAGANNHEHASNIALNDWRGHSTARPARPEESHLSPIRAHHSSFVVAGVPRTYHITPRIEIGQAFSEHRERYSPISVSKRREIFESMQDRKDPVSSVQQTSHIRG